MNRLTAEQLDDIAKRYQGDGEIMALVQEVRERRQVDRDLVNNSTSRNARWRGQGRGRK